MTTSSFQDDFHRELERQITEAARDLCNDLVKLGYGPLPKSYDTLERLLPPKPLEVAA